MTYLCINNINDIPLSSIFIKEFNSIYRIYYKLDNIIISGLSFTCSGKLEKGINKYKLIIYDDKQLTLIDELLSEKLNYYNSFLKKDKYTYIELNRNNIVDNILKTKQYKDSFNLNIIFINKYNNTPVIYIV